MVLASSSVRFSMHVYFCKKIAVWLYDFLLLQLSINIAMQVAVWVFVQFLCVCSAVNLRVGIYNEIPDLAKDGLASYKAMIESGFNNEYHTVDAVVDPSEYSPYGNLTAYLSQNGFDLIEMDTANLKEVVEADLVIQIPTPLPDDILQAAVSAVTINRFLYAYPTLVCGNFIVGLTPDICLLREARKNYIMFSKAMEECKTIIFNGGTYTWERMVGGKMNDEYGWYLPFLYIDGYIDIHGPHSVTQAVYEVLREVVDTELCQRLSWYISYCNDHKGESLNKCYVNFPGSYVNNSSNVYPDVENFKTYFYFGFSEKVAQIERGGIRKSYAAISGPLGSANYLLQFTDALVINKARWMAADDEKRNAIIAFVNYFLSNSLRRKIAMGEDLSPPQIRYLLQATETFYETTENIIYQDAFWSLNRAVPAPFLSDYERKKIEDVLTSRCVQIPVSNRGSRKFKQEL